MVNTATAILELIREDIGGESYEYLPLGRYVVAARGVCGGRPTIKYHRLDARWVMGYLESGKSAEWIAAQFDIPVEAVGETVELAGRYDYEKSYASPLRKGLARLEDATGLSRGASRWQLQRRQPA